MKMPERFTVRPASATAGSRLFVKLISVAAALGLLLGLVFVQFRSRPDKLPAPADGPEASVPDELDAAQKAVPAEAPAPAAPRSTIPVRRPAAPIVTTAPSGSAPGATAAAPRSGPVTEQAIARLSHLDGDKPLTLEQAAAVKQDLQRLVAEGPAAVDAIRQFLSRSTDLSLDEVKNEVGYSSLRAGLFDALRQIGGADAQAALADVLHTTADPGEVAQLARHLEFLAPGEYRNEILSAAQETLAQASDAKGKTDVGPLFQLVQTYGDANSIATLQSAAAQWKYYGLMALAGLPEGQGLPALIEQAQKLGANGQAQDPFAVQMLAQVASQYPEASSALLEQAKAGQIPDRTWRRIADALAGDQYRYIKDPNVDLTTLMRTPGVKTYHINAGNENFYSIPFNPGAAPGELAERRALVDQLLGVTSNPAAVAALQQARSQLDR